MIINIFYHAISVTKFICEITINQNIYNVIRNILILYMIFYTSIIQDFLQNYFQEVKIKH